MTAYRLAVQEFIQGLSFPKENNSKDLKGRVAEKNVNASKL